MIYDDIYEALTTLSYSCYAASKNSGWWDNTDPYDPTVFTSKLCLIHSEVSEACEGIRKDAMDDHLPHRKMAEVELADAVIRICDLAAAVNFDLGAAVKEKLAYNRNRADHKKENRQKDGGKKI